MKKTLIVWILSGALFTNLSASENVQTPHGLRIEVLSGDRSVNSVTSSANAVPPAVRVRTASGAPAAGVKVLFELVGNPKLGRFAGQQSIETETNGRGEAVAPGYQATSAGSFIVRATAQQGAERVSTEIHQRNHTRPYSIDREHHSSKAIWIALGVGAAGAATAILVKSRGSSSPSATISIGNPTVTGPR